MRKSTQLIMLMAAVPCLISGEVAARDNFLFSAWMNKKSHEIQFSVSRKNFPAPDQFDRYNVLLYGNPDTKNEFFNEAAKQKGLKGVVGDCFLLVDLPIGVADGNHSFGAFCKWSEDSTSSNTIVCADEMLGRFHRQSVGNANVTLEQLVSYVAQNCFGG